MRNLKPEQQDTGTRLATLFRIRGWKEIGDVCTQAKVGAEKSRGSSPISRCDTLLLQMPCGPF